MDWTAPYLLGVLAGYAAVEVWFVAMMVATGRRYRAASRRFRVGPLAPSATLSYEELGLLADGKRRWAEVALLRLCLEGHVREDGLLVLVNDPGETSAGERNTARGAIVGRLRRGRPVHLEDVLAAAQRRGDSSCAHRRLVELGLIDEYAAGIARTRDRVFASYLCLLMLAFVAVAGCLAVAATRSAGHPATVEGAAAGVAVVMLSMLVTALASRLTGGRLRPRTPAGGELLTRAAREVPRLADERLLHRVALHGLTVVPEFRRAAERGDPEADLSTRQRAFSAFAEVFSAVADLFGPAGGGRRG